MKVLVTGGTGYVGRAVVQMLLDRGHTPVVLSRHAHASGSPLGAQVRQADLATSDLAAVLADVDAICHLAGLTRARESWEHPADYFRVNVGGTAAVLAAAAEIGVQRLVFASTAAVYGAPAEQPMVEELPLSPPHPYAASKVAAEDVIAWQARTGELGAVVLRLFNVAGQADPDATRIVPRVLSHLCGATPALEVNGDGTAVRDYLHVNDAAAAFVAAVDAAPPPGEVLTLNVGSGLGTSVLDIVAAAERVTGRKASVVHMPPAAESPALVCDPSKATATLNWKPHRSDVASILTDAWAATANGDMK